MFANVGPADYNYDETISTLRYASRAKNIKNKAKINEDPKDALMKQYQREIEELRKLLEEGGSDGSEEEGESEGENGNIESNNAEVNGNDVDAVNVTTTRRIKVKTKEKEKKKVKRSPAELEEMQIKITEEKNLVCVIQARSGRVLPENGPRFCRLRSMVHLPHYAIYIHRERGRVSQILEPNI